MPQHSCTIVCIVSQERRKCVEIEHLMCMLENVCILAWVPSSLGGTCGATHDEARRVIAPSAFLVQAVRQAGKSVLVA